MGAFEYGTDNNEYTLVMPENDGSVPEVEPGDNEWEENGKYYAEDVFIDWYKVSGCRPSSNHIFRHRGFICQRKTGLCR